MLILWLGKDKWPKIVMSILSKILSFFTRVTTTESFSTTARFVKENSSQKGIIPAEIEPMQVDWPETVFSLTELGVIMGYLFDKVDHNGPNPVTIKSGT